MSRTYRANDPYLPDDPDAELLFYQERMERAEGQFRDPYDDESEDEEVSDAPF